jgi:Beta-propeller repeat/Phage integrase family
VTELNASGTALVYSTYLGGNANDYGYGIAVDGSGNSYITGDTSSTNFPTTSGAFQTVFGSGQSDAFVTKLNATGSALVYTTFLGGNSGDVGRGIAVDDSGNAYMTGDTSSTNFPTTSGAFQTVSGGYDAFVTKLNTDGTALVYSTYLGGIGFYNGGYGIAVDSSGNAYVTGGTSTTTFPTTSGAFQTVFGGGGQSDAFVTKLNASGTALIYSTYLGGNNGDVGYGIGVDGSGNAYVTGISNSTNFPTTSGAFQTVFGGTSDAFVTKLNATGSALVYSTYLGGNASDYGNGIAVDASGNAYVTGYTLSNNFPTTSGAFQTIFGGGSYPDAFVTLLNFPATVTVTISSSSPTSTYGEAVRFTATVAANGGGPTPSGTVLFFIDGSTTSFDGETLNNGSATSAFISTLSVGLHTVRANELANLFTSSFDLVDGGPTVTTKAAYSKNRREAVQPLTPDVSEALRGYLANRPMSIPVWPGDWFANAAEMLRLDLEAAGIPYKDAKGHVCDFHALRHSYISLLARSSIHPKVAQELARHSDIRLTMNVYTHTRLHDLAGAVDGLPALLENPSPSNELKATGTDPVCAGLRSVCATSGTEGDRVRPGGTGELAGCGNDPGPNSLSLQRVGASEDCQTLLDTKLPRMDSNHHKESQNPFGVFSAMSALRRLLLHSPAISRVTFHRY